MFELKNNFKMAKIALSIKDLVLIKALFERECEDRFNHLLKNDLVQNKYLSSRDLFKYYDMWDLTLKDIAAKIINQEKVENRKPDDNYLTNIDIPELTIASFKKLFSGVSEKVALKIKDDNDWQNRLKELQLRLDEVYKTLTADSIFEQVASVLPMTDKMKKALKSSLDKFEKATTEPTKTETKKDIKEEAVKEKPFTVNIFTSGGKA